MILSFYYLLFLFFCPAVLAIVQNVTVNSAAVGIQYLPPTAWTVAIDPRATGGSYTHAAAENATVVFTLTSPSTQIFWHGFPPQTAARYSICIDCASIEALGSVATIQTGSQSDDPVILFASKALENTTHTVAVRNLRNPIEGVVGVISLDSFSFTTDVAAPVSNPITSPATGTLSPSIAGIVGIVVASVMAAGVLLALAKFCTRRRQGGSNCSTTKRPKIWRKSCLSPGIPWRRHQRSASSESSPIIEAVWKSKPLTAPDELPIHNGQTHRSNHTDVTHRSNRGTSGVPVITITSPSTIATTASLYSTHQDIPAPSLFKLSFYDTDRALRQSDPYANYAAAYAAFAGITNNDDEHGQAAERQHDGEQQQQQQSALRDSSLLPPAQIQERNVQPVTSSTAASSQSPLPPSAFKCLAIRNGKKGIRTLSDKIKRGTLPSVPRQDGGSLRVSVAVDDGASPDKNGAEGGKEYLVKGNLAIAALSSDGKSHPPSILPAFSSDSSTPSAPVDKANAPAVPEPLDQTVVVPTLSHPTDPSTPDHGFWAGYGDFSALENTEDVEQVAESSSDGVESTLEEGEMSERALSRPQSLQAPSSPNLAQRPSSSEGQSGTKLQPFTSSMSIMTTETSNTRTTRSSLFSITPSVSDFPMPPFKRASSSGNSTGGRGSITASESAFTDLVASTPSLPSAASSSTSSKHSNGLRSNGAREKVPPSAFTAAAFGRPRRPKAPSFRVSRDGVASDAKSVQLGSGLGVPLLAQTRVPIRRGSSRSLKGSKRGSQSPGHRVVQLPIRGNALVPPLPRVAQRRIAETTQTRNAENRDNAARQSTWSEATSGETAGSNVPFHMRMLGNKGDGDSLLTSEDNEKQPSWNASRLTTASTLTTTDEEYAGNVRLVVANRLSIPSGPPRSATVARPTAPSLPASSPSPGSSNGKWEMFVANGNPTQDRPQAQGIATGLSISTDGNLYRAVNVPVSARTDMFDAGASEPFHMGGASTEPVIGFGSGMGMPWSPNFDWPASPALNLTSPAPAPVGGFPSAPIPPAVLSSKEQPSFRHGPAGRYDYPTSVSVSTVEAWNSGRPESNGPDSRPISRGTLASGETPGWKDIIGVPISGPQRETSSSTRESTHSTTSSFFGGVRTSLHSPLTVPPVPPVPPPVPTATPDSHKPAAPINTRQGWHARTSSSQGPIEKQRSQRQRQTGHTAVGGVNSVFAIPQSTVARPKLSLQRVEAAVEPTGNATPISRYNSPYTGYISPPSSAEPLISNR